MAQDATIFPKGEIAPNVHYTGIVWLNELSEADSIFNYNLTLATFEPRAKLDWHIHPGGQTLFITKGTSYYQERGKPPHIVHKGDVIKCLPGVEHWHAATPGSDFAYLSITGSQPTIWLEEVTDEKYPGAEERIIALSRDKWRWMSERNVDSLAALLHDEAVFVHMGATIFRDEELDVIRSGSVQYKHADIHEASVRFIGTTVLLLNRITLVAIVGGNEVTNPFEVTEVYVQQGDTWKLASLSFTRLLR